MKFSDLKFAQKLGLGFGLIILIAISLGLLAVINMRSVTVNAKHLANEYVPEVEISNAIERYSLLTMYAMRGYAFTEEDAYLTEGLDNMKKIKESLTKAETLAKEAKQLAKLNESISAITESIEKYEGLANQTVTVNHELETLRTEMNEIASIFIENCSLYLAGQNEAAMQEIRSGSRRANLDDRLRKITLINDVISKGNNLRITNFKAQATRDPESYEKAIKLFSISTEMEQLRNLTVKDANLKQLDKIEDTGKRYAEIMQTFLSDWKERETLNAERTKVGNEVIAKAQEVALAGIGHTADIADEAALKLSASSALMVIGLLVALAIGIILATVLTRSITTGLRRSVKFAEQVASGDLTADLEQQYLARKDEIGTLSNALNHMVGKLREIAESIIAGAENIAGASQQMASTSQEMSQGASEQASSVEEVSSSMEEMASNIQQNTDNAQQTEKIAQKAAVGIREGNLATNTAVEAMKNIADKIRIINDIAFQTNILALNAAVEAARAGEHGKGFAVVAAEVRKLAERSKIAADEIDALSKNGVDVAEKAGQKLNEIVPEIEKTAKLVQEIAAASIEQSTGSDQVNNAIQQLNNVTQQNAAASEEMATSSEELASQAEQLKEIIEYFKINRKTSSHMALSTRKFRNRVETDKPASKKMPASGKVLEMDEVASDKDFESF